MFEKASLSDIKGHDKMLTFEKEGWEPGNGPGVFYRCNQQASELQDST